MIDIQHHISELEQELAAYKAHLIVQEKKAYLQAMGILGTLIIITVSIAYLNDPVYWLLPGFVVLLGVIIPIQYFRISYMRTPSMLFGFVLATMDEFDPNVKSDPQSYEQELQNRLQSLRYLETMARYRSALTLWQQLVGGLRLIALIIFAPAVLFSPSILAQVGWSPIVICIGAALILFVIAEVVRRHRPQQTDFHVPSKDKNEVDSTKNL